MNVIPKTKLEIFWDWLLSFFYSFFHQSFIHSIHSQVARRHSFIQASSLKSAQIKLKPLEIIMIDLAAAVSKCDRIQFKSPFFQRRATTTQEGDWRPLILEFWHLDLHLAHLLALSRISSIRLDNVSCFWSSKKIIQVYISPILRWRWLLVCCFFLKNPGRDF